MTYWLLKSEPDTFGIEHLAAAPKRTSAWDGVRNYQARNLLRDEVKRGDQAFLYHSSCAVPGIAGVVTVTRAGYADATQFNRKSQYFDAASKVDSPRWYAIDVQLTRRCKRVITLDELRAHADGKLRGMRLLQRGNRLSVMPVSDAHWHFILTLE
ncbi:MAG: EVE domain-containing protein [Steroidobacteraceae bacterium]